MNAPTFVIAALVIVPSCVLAGMYMPDWMATIVGVIVIGGLIGSIVYGAVLLVQAILRHMSGQATAEERAMTPVYVSGAACFVAFMLHPFLVSRSSPLLSWVFPATVMAMAGMGVLAMRRCASIRRALADGACKRCLYPSTTDCLRCPECGATRWRVPASSSRR